MGVFVAGPRRGGAKTGRSGRAGVIVAVLVVLLAVGSWLAVRAWGNRQDSACARVIDADGRVYELSLGRDAEQTVTSGAGTNVIEVKGGSVRVREADCPNQDCVRQGWIDSAGQQIVCLPHKLTVDVVGGEAAAVDVMGR